MGVSLPQKVLNLLSVEQTSALTIAGPLGLPKTDITHMCISDMYAAVPNLDICHSLYSLRLQALPYQPYFSAGLSTLAYPLKLFPVPLY